MDLGPDNPGVVLVSMPAGKEEGCVDIQRPTESLPVIRTAFRFPTVNGEFFRIVSQSGVNSVNLFIGSPGSQLLKQICTIYTGAVIGNCVQLLMKKRITA